MQCEKCKKQEATIHLNEIVAGADEITKRNYCEACFRETQSELLKRPDIMAALDRLRSHKANPPDDGPSR
jgi:protein-arginine kinase activator protein McsA